MSAAAEVTPTEGKGKKKKKSRLRYYIGIPVALLALLVLYGLVPIKGTIKYGICKVFAEKRTIYPGELRVVSLLERDNDVRMEYTFINEFGAAQLNTITCVFRPDPVTTLALSNVVLNRRKLDQAELEKFNQTN